MKPNGMSDPEIVFPLLQELSIDWREFSSQDCSAMSGRCAFADLAGHNYVLAALLAFIAPIHHSWQAFEACQASIEDELDAFEKTGARKLSMDCKRDIGNMLTHLIEIRKLVTEIMLSPELIPVDFEATHARQCVQDIQDGVDIIDGQLHESGEPISAETNTTLFVDRLTGVVLLTEFGQVKDAVFQLKWVLNSLKQKLKAERDTHLGSFDVHVTAAAPLVQKKQLIADRIREAIDKSHLWE